MSKILANNRGLTLIELVVTMVIMMILASVVIPSAQMTSRRVKELELKRDLREIRTAIDDYKKYWDYAKWSNPNNPNIATNDTGYPKTLQDLVDGHDFGINGAVQQKVKFLRRIPVDPFHPVKRDAKPDDMWNLRSYVDEPDTKSWGGQDVYDVSSKSEETAIDGSKYKDW